MSMFDEVLVKEGIKIGKEIVYNFQTKDLDCVLFNFKIENDQFYQEVVKSRKPKKSEQREFKDKNGKVIMTLPLVVMDHVGWIEYSFTGGLNIYTSYGKNGWVDVGLLLENGIVINKVVNVRKMK